jgi:hypothetical protein
MINHIDEGCWELHLELILDNKKWRKFLLNQAKGEKGQKVEG